MNNFMKNLKNEYYNGENNVSITENGAIGYASTGTKLLDLNFKVSSLRGKTDDEIISSFVPAYYENPLLAIKWLFYARDVRGGLGERNLFRVVLKYLAETHPELAKAIIDIIPEYGRWDDLINLIDVSAIKEDVINIIVSQLNKDLDNYFNNKPISLLAKWMPSINTSSPETVAKARQICKATRVTEKIYRKTLSKLRAYLNVTEVHMSAKQWDKIDYEKVPSCANLLYNKAFLKNDTERRREFLSSLKKGEAKINAGVLFPHDIVHKYYEGGSSYWGKRINKPIDDTLEQLWKNLPDLINGNGNTLVVADGSGSMEATIGNTEITALEVANALAIYFAEHCGGGFKDTYITFSEKPQLVDFTKVNTLREKLEIASYYNEVSNTNIEAVFLLILNTAINNKMAQKDMPTNILIISDMEFDKATNLNESDEALFKNIERRYLKAKYKLPRLIFWNVNSRTGTIPVKESESGVALVSGFSPSVCKMVLSGECDAFKCLLSILNGERYNAVEEAVKSVL